MAGRQATEGRHLTGLREVLQAGDSNDSELLSDMLQNEGCLVRRAENGRVALERLDESTPAHILLDLMTPAMYGFEFVREMRRNERWRSVPIVAITAKEMSEEDRLQLNGRVQAVINQGAYNPEEVMGEIRDLLKRHAHPGS